MGVIHQRSFTGGELAPALYARSDLTKYATGLRTCRNNIVMRHGGTQNRPGSEFVGEIYSSAATTRLIPFIFNADQTYELEFSNLVMRVIRNGAYVTLTAVAITSISAANPAVVASTSHGLSTGDEVYITGVSGMTEVNGRNFKVTVTDANTYSLLNMDSTSFDATALTAGTGGTGAEIYQITTPYVTADLAAIKYAQSADVITLVHPDYQVRELSRSGHTNWTLTAISFAPETDTPTNLQVTSAGASTSWTGTYHVTAIDDETGEESLAVSVTFSGDNEPTQTPHSVTWNTVTGASEYNVYLRVSATGNTSTDPVTNGVFGLLGVAGTNAFSNYGGIDIDLSDTSPGTTARNPFDTSDGGTDSPSCVAYIQQRRAFGATVDEPEEIQMTQLGNYKNFQKHSEPQDDDAIHFRLAGKQVNEVRHLLDLGKFVVLTAGGEWTVDGNDAGIITPSQINAKQHSYNGSANVPAPIVINGTAFYVQARGSIIRDLSFDFEIDGYRGNDLTIFSAHLFDGYTIVDWAYQQNPHSVLWVVRSDGVLLGLTYVREHEVLAWHRHDFDGGTVENVSVIPEGNEDVLYLVVKRTINGATKRYVERLSSRNFTDIAVDAKFLDSSVTYDGRNTDTGHTMTLSGSGWTHSDTLTLTSSTAIFESTNIGNVIRLEDEDGEIVNCEIIAYTSTTVVSVHPDRDVPTSLQATATSTWTECVDEVSGLWHLEGEDVAVFADGFVVASPKNSSYTVVTVSSGSITLDKPYGVIHVGLPYLCDLETLDVDFPEGESFADKRSIVQEVTVHVQDTAGFYAGPKPPDSDTTDPLQYLTPVKSRSSESYDDPPSLRTDKVQVQIQGEWNSNGRIFIRQIDPAPMSILAIAPGGMFPVGGA